MNSNVKLVFFNFERRSQEWHNIIFII